MTEERIPLLQNGNNGDNGTRSSTFSLSSAKIPAYGSSSKTFTLPSERVVYSWNEIEVFAETSSQPFWSRRGSRGGQKHILKSVTGVAYPGELLAIMGGSGTGKTTLLNALTFQSPPNMTVSGVRCVNGVVVNARRLIAQSAYVQQDDLFIGCLTAKEHLTFQALVRMDKGIAYDKRLERVQDVIEELSLIKCQNTKIGILGRLKGLSGGEKKRLAFASEVLTNPKLFFCDEPTSGLDSAMALNVAQVLKAMAQTGKTVICTIHQPSSELYSLFDKLLLLAEGRVAFIGSPQEAHIFFKELQAPCPKNFNPADFFIQLLAIIPEKEQSSRQAANLICTKFQRSNFGVKVGLEAAATRENGDNDVFFNSNASKSRYKSSWCVQFQALLWRSWLSVIKEPLVIKVRLLQTTIISLIIGVIYFGQTLTQDGVMNINGVLFIFLTNMTFSNVFAVVTVFCSELPVFLREHRNGMYRSDVYFLCKTLAEAPVFVLIPLVFTSICYFMIGLDSQGLKFFTACGIIVLVVHVSTSFGYMISCLSSSISMALSVGPSLIIPFLFFGGFFLNVSSIPIYFKWIAYLSWFRYGNEALMINQWHNITNIDCQMNTTCPRDGHIVLENYSFHEENFYFDIIMLAVLIVFFRSVAYIALVFKTNQPT